MPWSGGMVPTYSDLTSLDFFLSGHLKSMVYSTRPSSIAELKENIWKECADISLSFFRKVQRNIHASIVMCMQINVNEFEHLIN